MSVERGQKAPGREEIDRCSDAAMLTLWYRDCVESIEEIKASIFGFDVAGVGEAAWRQRAGKKIGHLRMAARWCELRLLSLDLPVPYLPRDPRQEELRRAHARIDVLLKAMRAAGVEIPGEPR